MKIMLNGKEVKCHSFAELKPGDIFMYCNNNAIFVKTNASTCFSICNGGTEQYCNQPIIPFPEAVLVLDPDKCCKKEHHCKKEVDNV